MVVMMFFLVSDEILWLIYKNSGLYGVGVFCYRLGIDRVNMWLRFKLDVGFIW